MIKYGLLFSLFASTAAVAIPPFTELNTNDQNIRAARARLEQGGARFSDFLKKFNSYEPNTKSPDRKALECTVISAFQRKPDDRTPDVAWRKDLKKMLEEEGLVRILPEYFDKASCSLRYDPSTAMKTFLGLDRKFDTLHIGGAIDTVSPSREEKAGYLIGHPGQEVVSQLSISNEPCHSPDILSAPQDFRALHALLDAVKTGNFLHPIHRIVLHADSEGEVDLLYNGNFLDWVHTLLHVDETHIGVLEVRGPHTASDDVALKLALHGFVAYRSDKVEFSRQPAPIVTLPDKFNSAALGAAVAGVQTPVRDQLDSLTNTRAASPAPSSPLSEGGFSTPERRTASVGNQGSHFKKSTVYNGSPNRRERAVLGETLQNLHRQALEKTLTKASEEAFKASGGTLPYLQNIPRGWLPGEYLEANPEVLQLAMDGKEPPSFENFPNNFEGWQKEYGQWKMAIHLKAQEIFLDSFKPNSPYAQFKTASFGGQAPDNLNWLNYLQTHPSVFVKIASDLSIQTDDKRRLTYINGIQPPATSKQAAQYLQELDSKMPPEGQMKLAMAVHRWVVDDIRSYGTLKPSRPFHPWVKDSPPGLDLHVLYMNMLGAAQYPDTCGDLSKSFMLDFGFSEDSMKDYYVKLQYLDWLQDEVKGYESDEKAGIGYLPYLPGWFSQDMVPALKEDFKKVIRSLKAQVPTLRDGEIPAALNFPVLFRKIPTLTQYLHGEEWAIWNNPNGVDLTDLEHREARAIFQVVGPLLALNAFFDDSNLKDFWHHYTSINLPPPPGWGFKALKRHNEYTPPEVDPAKLENPYLSLEDAIVAFTAMDATERENLQIAWLPHDLLAKWWKEARTGTHLMATKDLGGVDIVRYIEEHQKGRTKAQMKGLLALRSDTLDEDERVKLCYHITETTQNLILAELSTPTTKASKGSGNHRSGNRSLWTACKWIGGGVVITGTVIVVSKWATGFWNPLSGISGVLRGPNT